MNGKKRILYLVLICLLIHTGCFRGIKADDIEEEPVPMRMMLTRGLRDLGLMTDIYGSGSLKIQSAPLVDRTRPEWRKGGELSQNFTEKIKNAVSSIGGSVEFIPYDPVFAHVQMVKYDTEFEKKALPDVVIEGAIFDFNPGIEKKGGQGSSAKIVFNFINFHTMASISRVRTENELSLDKSKERNKVSVTLTGPSYQKIGDIEKANGEDEGLQMLVELSMIQLIGKHLALPYWKLLDGAKPDPVVLDSIKRAYFKLNEPARISKVQELLFLHGYDVKPTGILNMETKIALQDYENTETLFHRPIDLKLYLKLYFSLPITDETLERKFLLDRMQRPS